MRSFVRSSFVWMGLASVMVPVAASAQAVAPAGYVASSSPTMMVGADGRPVPVRPVSAVASAPGQGGLAASRVMAPAQDAAPHKHKFRSMCASCMKKQEAMPVERIVACAHSKNGVCPTCQALLAMPGSVTIGAPAPGSAAAPAGEAPGRAVVSNSPPAGQTPGAAQYAAQAAPVSAVYDPSQLPGPTPIGVMQANFAQPGAMPAAPASVPTAGSLQPGHAVAEGGNTPAPFMHKSTGSKNPMILTHLFGFRNYAADWREQRNDKKNQAHASIPYNNDGTTINELPSSMVYGKQH